MQFPGISGKWKVKSVRVGAVAARERGARPAAAGINEDGAERPAP